LLLFDLPLSLLILLLHLSLVCCPSYVFPFPDSHFLPELRMSKVDHAPFERVKQRPPDDRWFRQKKKERKEKKKKKKKTRACAIACLLDAKREMRAEEKVKKQADMRIASQQ
jgi:hypothetical protein